MGNKGHFQERRRNHRGDRDFVSEPADEPSYFRRPTPSASDTIDAEVLWFNPGKGFGFIKAADGSEAFLHMRALEAAGHSIVSEGARMKVTLQDGPKGKQVSQVLEVMDAGSSQPDRRPAARAMSQRSLPPSSSGQEGEGTVKWYNADKGFGFISLEAGGNDVFVHATALTRSGMSTLSEGQRVIISYAQGQKGPEARSIRPA
ncbi:CspA family cold shock protein [Pseudaminobacter sp. 19-2017]|uniref:CspA family cold shock protein n=1 Tax=Pseudaminobacter soli (ex Zhang et al. 2022) TaxID=2831468 RepID=A0A942E7K1_9HYPH|nr:cold-shock protein [Pseudaminobacter soli]MBS3652583.1 CspA family cold shock protein [Pseudaminobacter soli]